MQNKNKKNNAVNKYKSLYMSLGMCYGVSIGLAFGQILFPDNMALGMGYGVSIGMCIGLALGAAKDKRLSENMMKITKIETMENTAEIKIYVVDKDGVEKIYNVTQKEKKREKFKIGDRVAEDKKQTLVSLEG